MSVIVTRSALVLLLAVCPFFGTFAGEAHDSPTEASRTAEGLRALRENRLADAIAQFAALASASNSPNRDFFLYNLARANYHGGNFANARTAFDELTSKFSQSSYRPFAEFFLGNLDYRTGNYRLSAQHYLSALGGSTETRLNRLAMKSLEAIAQQQADIRFDLSEIKALPERKRCELSHALALIMLQRHSFEEAARMNALCAANQPLPSASDLDTNALSRDVRIAVVVPMSGELQSYGEDIFNGATIGVEQAGKETGRRIRLIPFDSKGDPVTAGRIIRELIDTKIDAVIGPLTSDEAAVASASLGTRLLPLIAPAATDAGLTLLGNSAFQLSPNLELQGVVMAEYAVRTLKADTAAIVTAPNADNLTMARAFAAHFTKLGGTITATEYYRPRDKDFGTYIRDIKNVAMGFHVDSAAYVDDNGDTLELDAVPAHVDCLYMPGSADQLRQLLPQINFYNLRGAYLGSDGWGDEILYNLGDDITKGALFPSPFVTGGQSEQVLRFSAAYKARYDKEPSRVARLGYDACKIIADALKRGARSREELTREIRATSDFDGAAGGVTFGDRRENIELPLYKILSGQAVLVQIGRLPLENVNPENR